LNPHNEKRLVTHVIMVGLMVRMFTIVSTPGSTTTPIIVLLGVALLLGWFYLLASRCSWTRKAPDDR
jgi:LPXTG-motif cell wall-anchored protein